MRSGCSFTCCPVTISTRVEIARMASRISGAIPPCTRTRIGSTAPPLSPPECYTPDTSALDSSCPPVEDPRGSGKTRNDETRGEVKVFHRESAKVAKGRNYRRNTKLRSEPYKGRQD